MSTVQQRERKGAASLLRGCVRCAVLALAVAVPMAGQGSRGPGGPGGMPGHPGGFPGGPAGPGGMTGPGMGRVPSSNFAGGGNAPVSTTPGSRMQGPGGRWWDNRGYAQSVGLTGDQQRRMDAVFQENRNSLVTGLDNLRKAQGRLDALTAAGHPNEAAVLTEIQNVAQARADLAKANTHMQLQLRNELTDDQLSKLDKLK